VKIGKGSCTGHRSQLDTVRSAMGEGYDANDNNGIMAEGEGLWFGAKIVEAQFKANRNIRFCSVRLLRKI